MKILTVNGSPRKSSTSGLLLAEFEKLLPREIDHKGLSVKNCTDFSPQNQDVTVLAFPLYVDGLPSQLLSFLVSGGADKIFTEGTSVYCIINCGFYEASHSRVASSIIKNCCIRKDAEYMGCLRIGSGGGIVSALKRESLGFPVRKISRELSRFAHAVINRRKYDNEVSADYPRFIYKTGADVAWRIQAVRNGVSLHGMPKHTDRDIV